MKRGKIVGLLVVALVVNTAIGFLTVIAISDVELVKYDSDGRVLFK